jgi:putative ABC transport system permease protein
VLALKQIKKDYTSGSETVQALKGIDIAFRESEFVSILGQSGCGKTTLLNIIGGLDNYTSGDLIINGKSTKKFKDRDWDTYRNHSIGFVFQSYNLIPHQNVLANVELALTLSGVSKSERRRRATEALKQVGLGDQLKKMPNQMSGGQMQRVAIARALVNNPDILLADEPTGALDSETSVQVMEILKEVAKDRLVIMVTHNPELAERYSTRIVRLLDGAIVSDSMPYDPETAAVKPESAAKKPSMSFTTATSLSLKNLMTKKGRTLLTAFAGSIGIIGIALILSLSSGVQDYIDRMEEETLTSYPITIQEASMDLTSLMTSQMGSGETEEHEAGQVYSSSIMTGIMDTMMSEITTNDLGSFKKYLETEDSEVAALCSEIQYTYPTQIGIYANTAAGAIQQVNPATVMSDIGMGSVMGGSTLRMGADICEELVDSESMRDSDYELLTGSWPENYNEVVLTVTNNYELSDYTLYALGLLDSSELKAAFQEAQQSLAENGSFDGEITLTQSQATYSYEELMDLDLRLVLPTDYYVQQADGTWADMREDADFMADLVASAEPLHVVGIVRSTSDSGSSYGTLGYTTALTEYVIQRTEASDILRQQKSDPETDVFTGLPFPGTDAAEAVSETESGPTQAQLDLLAQVIAALPEMYQDQISALDTDQQLEILVGQGLLTQADYDALGDSGAPTVSSSTYDENLTALYDASLDQPSSISLYAASFDDKEAITQALDDYNDRMTQAGDDDQVIQYTDYVGLLMKSVTNIVSMVSYVLIAFVGISLVVSSIMIGVITLISVQERTKEIGILRAMGASKRDVSRVFNAETLIIGLVAGLMGIGITLLLNIPINAIIQHLAGVDHVAQLPLAGGVILVAISVILTVLAGLIPAKAAAKKDPVEALRTE